VTPPPGSAGLRVVTLNLASGRGAGGAALAAPDLARSLAALADLAPDVVCLQEVDRGQPRSGGVDQAALVAGVVGADHWRFAPALSGTPGPRRTWEPVAGRLAGPENLQDGASGGGPLFGVALLSRVPVASWHVLALGAGRGRLPLRGVDPRTGRAAWWVFPDEPRVAVAAVLGDGSVVACTHLSFAPVTALRQLRRLRRWLAQAPGADGAVRLLAGDLNLPGGLPARVAGGQGLVRGATYPAAAPRLQLDHVLSLGAPVSAGGAVVAVAGGDHRAVVADVTPRRT
jgi:endonuclease/exonuclease/phosphatase family metal-dependent hydrolase